MTRGKHYVENVRQAALGQQQPSEQPHAHVLMFGAQHARELFGLASRTAGQHRQQPYARHEQEARTRP